MITLQTKMDGFPQEIIEKPKPAVIPFPCTGNLSIGQAADIFKYREDDYCSRGQRRDQSADVRNMGQFAGGGKTGGQNDADQH